MTIYADFLTHSKRFFTKAGAAYRGLRRLMKIALGAGLLLFLLLLVFIINVSHHPHKKTQTQKIHAHVVQQRTSTPALDTANHVNEALSDLQAKLANVEQMLAKNSGAIDRDKLKNDIHLMIRTLNQITLDEKQAYETLSAQIHGLSTALSHYQKTTVQKLDAMDAKNHPLKCLEPSHLPFTVQSIDRINGQDVVSVLYAAKNAALEKDFSIAGWKLVASDYEQQKARFVNRQGACVSVNLPGSF